MTEHLTAVTRTQGNNRALKEGAVAPAGFPLAFEEVPVLVDAFRRMVRELAYDVCEMALTTYPPPGSTASGSPHFRFSSCADSTMARSWFAATA